MFLDSPIARLTAANTVANSASSVSRSRSLSRVSLSASASASNSNSLSPPHPGGAGYRPGVQRASSLDRSTLTTLPAPTSTELSPCPYNDAAHSHYFTSSTTEAAAAASERGAAARRLRAHSSEYQQRQGLQTQSSAALRPVRSEYQPRPDHPAYRHPAYQPTGEAYRMDQLDTTARLYGSVSAVAAPAAATSVGASGPYQQQAYTAAERAALHQPGGRGRHYFTDRYARQRRAPTASAANAAGAGYAADFAPPRRQASAATGSAAGGGVVGRGGGGGGAGSVPVSGVTVSVFEAQAAALQSAVRSTSRERGGRGSGSATRHGWSNGGGEGISTSSRRSISPAEYFTTAGGNDGSVYFDPPVSVHRTAPVGRARSISPTMGLRQTTGTTGYSHAPLDPYSTSHGPYDPHGFGYEREVNGYDAYEWGRGQSAPDVDGVDQEALFWEAAYGNYRSGTRGGMYAPAPPQRGRAATRNGTGTAGVGAGAETGAGGSEGVGADGAPLHLMYRHYYPGRRIRRWRSVSPDGEVREFSRVEPLPPSSHWTRQASHWGHGQGQGQGQGGHVYGVHDSSRHFGADGDGVSVGSDSRGGGGAGGGGGGYQYQYAGGDGYRGGLASSSAGDYGTYRGYGDNAGYSAGAGAGLGLYQDDEYLLDAFGGGGSGGSVSQYYLPSAAGVGDWR